MTMARLISAALLRKHVLAFLAGAIALLPGRSFAEEPAEGFTLVPSLGILSHGDYHRGLVQFSGGDSEFLLIDPGTNVVLGIQGEYRFSGRLAGFLGLHYSPGDADYFEQDNARPGADFDILSVDLGVLFDVVSGGTIDVAVGGGLVFSSFSVDQLNWDDRPMAHRTSALGLEGLGVVGIPLSGRLSLRAQLRLGFVSPSYGDLEDAIARAEDETAAAVEGRLIPFGELSLGLAIGL